MSHELRTPLNAIIGFSDMVQCDILKLNCPEPYRGYARDIHRSGSHLLKIINDILDMSKIEAGQLTLRDDVVDLETVLHDCRHMTAPHATNANVTVMIEVPSAPILVRADPVRLNQILLNLLSNAIKFTPAVGRVTVLARVQDDGQVAIAVQDTGIGMDQAEVAIALQPFRQVDNALARQYEGTGLGLPLVKALVGLHGGQVRIESAKGVGTTVTVLLPPERLDSKPLAGRRPDAAA
jgi:signal transduction histidine kinase